MLIAELCIERCTKIEYEYEYRVAEYEYGGKTELHNALCICEVTKPDEIVRLQLVRLAIGPTRNRVSQRREREPNK
jgi:hypothetical protein